MSILGGLMKIGRGVAEIIGNIMLLNRRYFMKKYIGANLIKATPMTRGEYNDYANDPSRRLIENIASAMDGDPNTPGYLVGYPDKKTEFSGELKGESEYISWVPKDNFENIYRKIGE